MRISPVAGKDLTTKPLSRRREFVDGFVVAARGAEKCVVRPAKTLGADRFDAPLGHVNPEITSLSTRGKDDRATFPPAASADASAQRGRALNRMRSVAGSLALGAAALFLGACADRAETRASAFGASARQTEAAPDVASYWHGDGVSGAPSITIRLSEQKAYFYRAGVLVGVSAISTGREGHDTRPGVFRISQLDRDHASNLYGEYADARGVTVVRNVTTAEGGRPAGAHFVGAPMPFFMRFDGGTGMHAGFLPGYPASHGCIRMPEQMAEAFFRSVRVGTPVTVEA